MLYLDFIVQAKEEVLAQASNGLWYLEPDWRYILFSASLDVEKIDNFTMTLDELEDVLKLEAEKRNTEKSKKQDVLEWVYGIISNEIQPAVLAEETDFVKAATEFMKYNHEAQRLKEQEDWNKFKET